MLETWTIFLSRPMGRTMEDTSTVASGKTCFSFHNDLRLRVLHDHGKLARVDPDMVHHAPRLSVPGDVGQPLVDVVDG